MLRIIKVKKSKGSLGSVVGKEGSVKLLGSDISGAETFVKFGRELVNLKNLALQWNSTLFDTALNHPRRPWDVMSGDGKPLILIVKKNEVVAVDGGSRTTTKVKSDDLMMEDYDNANSTILLMNNSGKELLVALDEISSVSSFTIVNGKELKSASWTAESSGGILPVLRHDQSSAYVEVVNRGKPSLYHLEGGSVKSGKISLTAPSSTGKLMATNRNEVIHISSQGLNMYSIEGQSATFKFYCPVFSLKQGWTQPFVDTLKLMKIDGDQEAVIGTGPKGIEYFPLSQSCKIYVVDVGKNTENDTMKAKHAQIAATSAKKGNQFDVLGYYHGELYEITLKVEEAKEPNLKDSPKVAESMKSIKVSASKKVQMVEGEPNSKPTRWLRDSIDESSFKNIVDKLTGKVQFSFPLIDLQDRMGLPIKLMAYYEESESEEMSVLGRYWTLGKDCIVLDHGSSVFEDLQGYYLVKDQMKIKLERDFGAQLGSKIRFNMQGNRNVTFEYDGNEEKWEAGNGKVRYVYGIKNQGAVNVLAWNDWNGPSGQFDPSKSHVVQWNLVEIKSEFSDKVKIAYGYTKQDPKSNMIHLDSISDGDKTSIKFQYQNIQGVGHKVDSSRVAKELQFINDKLLTGVVIDTPNYSQNLKITTTKIDNLYYLESIKQDGDGDSVLGFKYNKQDELKPRLAQFQLPSKSTLGFEYRKQSVPTQRFQRQVAKLSDLYSGSGYSLLITKESEETRLKIEQRDSSGWNYSIKEATLFVDSHNARKIKSYQPFMHQNYFAVVVSYQGAGSKIYIFNKDQTDTWKQESEGTLTSQVFNDKLFKYDFQEDSFVYYAAGKISLEYKKSGSVKWTRLSHDIGNPDMIVLLKRGAVFYQGDLKLIRWNHSDNLKQVVLTTAAGDKPNVKELESFFTRIDLQGSDPNNPEESKKEIDEYKKDLTEQFNANGLVMYNNLVALRTAGLDALGKTTMKVFLYLLGKDYEVSSRQTITLDGEDLNKFNLTLDVFDEFKSKDIKNLDKYRFEFKKEANLYKLKFVSATDKKGKPTEPSAQNKQSIGMYERKMRIPLDFEKYMMQVNQDGIILGNQQIYHSNGKFQTKPIDRDSLKLTKFRIPLGDYTVFKKDSDDAEVQVCSVGKLGYCESLLTNSARNVSVKYPYYFVSQRRNDIVVLPLKSRGWEKRVEYPSEVLHGSTSHSVLVTTRMSDNATIIRPLKTLNNDNAISVQVIVQEKLSTPNEEYTIKYEYSEPVLSNAEVLFRKAVVIPGGQKQVTGYYEETTNLQTNEQVVQVMTSDGKVFDPEYVKRMHEMEDEQKKQQDRPLVDEDGTIFDASRNRPILKTKPYARSENLIHFAGFEDYEDLQGWNFSGQNIRRNAFSATGRNYLLLKTNEQLVKELKSVTYYDYFVASAWIRTTQDVSIGNSTDVIGVEIDRKEIRGEIKQRNGEWIYVEATTRSFEVPKSDQPIKVNLKVTIKAAGANEVHVDHVRITPLNFDFEANVYDARTGRTTAVIRNNGQVSHRVYDVYNRRVAEVSEQGLVKFLASYSKRVQMKILAGSRQEGISSSRVQIRPKKGWLESFSPFSVEERWELGGSGNKARPGILQLQGMATYKHRFSGDSIAIRMIYSVINTGQLELNVAKTSVIVANDVLKCGATSARVPKNGELIVLTTPKLVTIWIEGHIIHEAVQNVKNFNNEAVSIQTNALVEVKDLVIMENTELQVSYLNRDSKPLQEVLLQDSENILVRQLVYDSIGRKVAETVWSKLPIAGAGSGSQVLQYREDFIQNDRQTESFLTTGMMRGRVTSGNEMYSGYPYSQTEYYNNPLEIRHRAGHPGEKYSLKGEFKHEYKIESDLSFIKLYYPKDKGFRQEQEKKSNGKTQVVVYNRCNKKVAEFIQVSDFNNILTTYSYNEQSNQVQMIPPNYYDEKNKASRTVQGFKPELDEIQSPWASTTTYDPSGEYVVMKSTPDGGRVEFLYNDLKQLTYQLHYDSNNVDKIVYFLYNAAGKVCEAGKLEANRQVEELVRQKGKSYQDIPNRQNAVYFDYGESDPNPSVRGRMQRIVKRNNDVHFDEALFYDEDGHMIAKTYISPVKNESLSLEYLQENDKIGGIRYPFLVGGDQLVLKFDHNLRGEVTRVSRVQISGQDKVSELPIVDIDHDAQGKVTRIGHKYGGYSFDQSYVYKAPGYLSAIQNEFLNETLYYTSKGYGTEPTGDGSILRTEFQARWHDRCNQNLIPLTARAFESERMSLDLAEVCFDSLNSLGYFDQMGRPQKTYYPDLEANMPVACCTGYNRKHISSMIFKKGFPEIYGHAYDYGTHGELIAAKSFVGKEKDELEPSLKESDAVENLSRTILNDQRQKASTLWKDLVNSNLIDRVNGIKAFYRGSSGLSVDVMANVAHILYTNNLAGLTDPKCEYLLQGSDQKHKKKCEELMNKVRSPPMESKFQTILEQNAKIKQKLVSRLWKMLASALGNSPGDVESFSIDPNGNHRVFYTGFNRFEIEYKSQKNQIATIKQEKMSREIQHDSEGNVVKALHKNIEKIEYDPLTQRVSRIELTNRSRVIEFGFDFRGERTLKRVRNRDNQVISETYYVRDNKGNTLVEYKLEYPNPSQPTKSINTVTAYIHGPLGLLGFFRNNRYYNVLLDHEGSTRLVVHNGEVVAAYDYFPYGQLMRSYGSNPEAHISYRYTGQEFDEETGLYNYHARLYDPDIGRFFQMDPMEQYASPYKYAGNSPVSQIDPDGQIAITLIVMAIGALVGAYMGASSANNSWNPAKWAWDDKKTWIGIFAGAAMGAMAVYGGGATFSYFAGMFGSSMAAALATGAISVAGAFLGAAAAANEWNPAKWDWSSPAVWNGFLNGISIALSFPSGFVGIKRTFFSFAFRTSKIIYGVAMSSGFLLLLYVGASMANNFNFRLDTWDWKSPRTWFGMVEGVSTLFLGTASAVKHGATKTHFIIQPNNMKLAWYRINIPAKSFTVKQVGNQFVMTWYKYGNRMGIQIVKSEASLLKYTKPVVGFTEAFFISHAQRVKSVLAMGMFGGFHVHNFQTYFAHEPKKLDNTTEPNQPKARRKRFVVTSDRPAASSSTSFSGWMNDFVKIFTELFESSVPNLKSSNVKLNYGLEQFTASTSSEPSKRSFEKLCYSSSNSQNSHVICQQRESIVNVFSKHSSFNSENFGTDTFKNCMPLSWHQFPSVACDGQQTSFIYTPNHSLRVFDLVDGWLLLARITPAAVKNMKAGLQHFKDALFTTRSNIKQLKNLEYHKCELGKDVTDLRNIMLNVGLSTNVDWAVPILQDLEDDIVEFSRKKNPQKSDLVLLQERIESLRDDLVEGSSDIQIQPDVIHAMVEEIGYQLDGQHTEIGGVLQAMQWKLLGFERSFTHSVL